MMVATIGNVAKDGKTGIVAESDETSVRRHKNHKTHDAPTLRLFCFAWTPRHPNEERLISFSRKELERCDGHFFFTDVEAPGDDSAGDWMRVQLPPTSQNRSESNWLDHTIMIGVARIWDWIFQMDLASQYDWIMHVELDHFVMADRVRLFVQQYLDIIQEGQNRTDGSMLFYWGNAFLFNSALVRDMAANWNELGTPIQEDRGKGCPAVSSKRVDQVGFCESDMVYPMLPSRLNISSYGADGCEKPSVTPWGATLPLACWQGNQVGLNNDNGETILRSIATLHGAISMDEANERCNTAGDDILANHCMTLYDASKVPLMHNFKSPELHELAQQLFL